MRRVVGSLVAGGVLGVEGTWWNKKRIHRARYGTFEKQKFPARGKVDLKGSIRYGTWIRHDVKKFRDTGELKEGRKLAEKITRLEKEIERIEKELSATAPDSNTIKSFQATLPQDDTGKLLAIAEFQEKYPRYRNLCNSLSEKTLSLSLLPSLISLGGVERTFVDLKDIESKYWRTQFKFVLSKSKSEWDVGRYGSVEDYAKKVLERMFGEGCTKGMDFHVKDIKDANIAGMVNLMTGEVTVKDQHFAIVASVKIHEASHRFSQTRERKVFSGSFWMRAAQSLYGRFAGLVDREIMVIEEATAYLGQEAGCLLMPDKELRDLAVQSFNLYKRAFVEEYFNGEMEYHREAIAVADAAIETYGDPITAFNKVSKMKKLPEEITNIIDRNRKDWENLQKLKKGYDWKSLESKVEALQKRVHELQQKYECDPDAIESLETIEVKK